MQRNGAIGRGQPINRGALQSLARNTKNRNIDLKQPPTQSLRATTMRGPTRTHLGTFTCLLALPSSVATLGCSSVAHRGALGLEVHTLASSSLVEAWLEYTYVCEKLW